MGIAFAFQFMPLIFLNIFFIKICTNRMCSCFSVREIWWEEGQKDVPVVGVVVAGCVVLPGDGGHGSRPGNCLGFHVGCVSYLEHCIIQLDSEIFFYTFIRTSVIRLRCTYCCVK